MLRCKHCCLPEFICLCEEKPVLDVSAEFWLLMHENEHDKATNTGYLLAGAVPGSCLFTWSRVCPDKGLLTLLSDRRYFPVLVFPSDYARSQAQDVILGAAAQIPVGTVLAFILIDGTWQQARKIYNHSPYLHGLPILDFHSARQSAYRLRRIRHESHFCTVESGIEALAWLEDAVSANQLRRYFSSFNSDYHSSKLAAMESS